MTGRKPIDVPFASHQLPRHIVELLRTTEASRLQKENAHVPSGFRIEAERRAVNALLERGWVPLLVIPSQAYEVPHCRQCNHRYGTQDMQPTNVEQPIFLLARGRDAEIESLRTALVDAERAKHDAARDWEKAEHKLRPLEMERDQLKDEVARVRAAEERSARRLTETAARLHCMESDLARVRREVGEKEWKRICPPPPKKESDASG